MKNPFVLFLFVSFSSFAQFSIGHTTMTFNDPARTGGFGTGGGTGRQIQTEIYYPSTATGTSTPFANGAFPIIVFGHGFAMTWDAYNNIWEHYVSRGYIMAFVRTESSLFPSPNHGDFGLDLKLVAEKMLDLPSNNLFFAGHVYPKVGLMGHSMGGGASFLAANNNTNIDALIGLAPAETNPSAITAASNVQVPSIIFSGSSDGVTPPSQHHIPMHNAIASNCKTFVSILGGGHCYFANANFNCDFGESTSSTGISITRSQQQMTTFEVLDPWLDFLLKDICVSYEAFELSVSDTPGTNAQTTCPLIPIVDIAQNGSILSTSSIGISYQWFLNGQPISGANSNEYNTAFTTGGTYFVEVTFAYGCGISPNLNILGLENPLNDSITIHPNPTDDYLTIKHNSTGNLNATLSALNGTKIFENIPIEQLVTLDLSSFLPGIYMLKLEETGFTRMEKIIIL